MKRCRGFTLVEVLVALALSALLVMACAALQVFGAAALIANSGVARQQENGRYALRLLSREIEMAGFYGGLALPPRGSTVTAEDDCAAFLLQFSAALEVFTESNLSGLPARCLPQADWLRGSAVIVVRRTMDSPLPASRLESAALYLDTLALPSRLLSGSAVLEEGLGKVWRYQPAVFFLRRYSVSRGDALPALCRRRLSPRRPAIAPTECLVEGIASMHLELGDPSIDTLPPETARLSLSAKSPLSSGLADMAMNALLALRNVSAGRLGS